MQCVGAAGRCMQPLKGNQQQGRKDQRDSTQVASPLVVRAEALGGNSPQPGVLSASQPASQTPAGTNPSLQGSVQGHLFDQGLACAALSVSVCVMCVYASRCVLQAARG